MELLNQCKTCKFNSLGSCAGNGNGAYKYGDEITDDSIPCSKWDADLDYFTELVSHSPWYIRERFLNCKIDYPTFLKLINADSARKPIDVNIYDAIKHIYGLSLVDLAVILNVPFGVMYRARSVGTPTKRVMAFSQTLCIPVELFRKATTRDFPTIERCKSEFETKYNTSELLKICPEWKIELTRRVASVICCPIHIAKKIVRVDNLNWQIDASNTLTPYEKELVDFVARSIAKSGKKLRSIEYTIDIASMPHLYYKCL